MSIEGRRSQPRTRYRYRTAAVVGPWRNTREAALRDAVKAGQARFVEGEPDGVSWKLPGRIEAKPRGTSA